MITSRPGPKLDRSIVAAAVTAVALIAALAGGTLWTVRRMQHHMARAEAARAVIAEGESILGHLVQQPAVTSSVSSQVSWEDFSRLVSSLRTLQGNLQYVSVTKGDVTVFHEHAPIASEALPPAPSKALTRGDIQLTRRMLEVDGKELPVVAFSQGFHTHDGSNGVVEAAFRIEAVGHEERVARSAIASMFNLSLATVIVAFIICAAAVLWVLRREAIRERLRREQEHLTFSGVLASGIAHDFRNPMSSLRLDVQMLERRVGMPDADLGKIRSLTSRIRDTLDRMDKVFQEFLYLSKPPSGQREAVDLVDAVRDGIALLAPRFEASGQLVETDFPDARVTVLAFPSALRRAIVNVLTNAEQFTPPGGRIFVRVRAMASEAVLEIEDTGPGIPPAERRRVFDMFETSRPEGTGLGLFLAKTAVERSGGVIEAVDGHDQGACIRIGLLLALSEESDVTE